MDNRLNLVSKNDEELHFSDSKNGLRFFKNKNKSVEIILNSGEHYSSLLLRKEQVEFLCNWLKRKERPEEVLKMIDEYLTQAGKDLII